MFILPSTLLMELAFQRMVCATAGKDPVALKKAHEELRLACREFDKETRLLEVFLVVGTVVVLAGILVVKLL